MPFEHEDQSSYAQDQLLHILEYVPLKWGPWQAFKYIAKRVLLDQKWIAFCLKNAVLVESLAILIDRISSKFGESRFNRTSLNFAQMLTKFFVNLEN